MIVYHGSTLCVENPLVGVCRDNLDFGKGFYLTDICEQAISWAKRVAIIYNKPNAYLNKYELDYETIKELDKPKLLEKYKPFYTSKMDALYKGLLKHFSIKLADQITYQNKEKIYEKIFKELEEYITKILPLRMENEQSKTYKEVIGEYEKFENYEVGKLDQNEGIEKRMTLIAISRKLFTHYHTK